MTKRKKNKTIIAAHDKLGVVGQRVEIAGITATVVDDATAEQADFVMCAPVSYFPDDVHTVCADCGAPIVHRPHVPTKPPKLCVTCATQLMEADRRGVM